jgi:HAD superfamily hydrolase (TIGR01509 family)
MRKIEAIVFDLDGVLVDAVEWHYVALNRALGFFGFEISRYAHVTTYDGLPTRTKLDMLSDEVGLPKTLHSLIRKLKQKFTLQIIAVECRPRFQHRYAIKRLIKDGYRIAVASNAVHESVALMLKQIGVIDDIEFFLSNEDVLQPKPSPEIYSKAAVKLSLSPGRVLAVEDNSNGVRAALGAGMAICEVNCSADVTYQLIKKRIEEL